MSKHLLMLGLLILVTINMQAGWIIVERTNKYGQKETTESTLYIQNNIVKSVEQDQTIIFDLNQWKVTLISKDLKGYWIGTPAKYLEFIKNYSLAYLKNELALANGQEKQALLELYEDIKLDIQQSGNNIVSFIGELPVEIIMTDESDMIMGYRVNQFLVYSDHNIVEEIWLTRDLSISDEYDFEKFRSFIDEMSWGIFFQDYRSSKQYINFMKLGLPLRTKKEWDNESINITEVISVERANIPEKAFHPPTRYKLMSLSELGIVFN